MEPSPTNIRKHHTNLEKSFSHDIIATPYTYPSPTKNRKFSEAASPYLEPSPTSTKKSLGSSVTNSSAPSIVLLSSKHEHSQPATHLPTNSSTHIHQASSSHFIYVPPEVRRERERKMSMIFRR